MNINYSGTELDLFSHAAHWKAYWSRFLQPYVKGHVLEVGAGIGSSTLALSACSYTSWTCLEPDLELAMKLNKVLNKNKEEGQYKIITGDIEGVKIEEYYNTILYIDVLEHIENDSAELLKAVTRLATNGNLIILCPAHQWLFSEFDKSIGHFRRYNKRSLAEIIPNGFRPIKNLYLDSVGLIASLANRHILKNTMPSEKQIALWDRIMVPCSRLIDPLLFFSMGKSILGIWQKQSGMR